MHHAFVTSFARVAPRVAAQIGTNFLVVAALLSGGCSSDDSGSPSSTRGSILLQDPNNYSTESSLTIPTIETASGVDLDVCWTDAVKDLQCHELDPQTGLDNMSMLRFLHLTNDQVAAKLTTGQLPQSAVDGYADFHTDHESTCAKLSSLSLFGSKFEISEQYVESSDRVYLLILSKGTTPGVGARTMTFLKPTEASSNTEVNVPTGCGLLDFAAHLSTAKPVSAPAKAPWVVDWQDMTRDGQGNAIDFQSVDRLLLGFFADKTVADLEEQIFDIETIATSMWEIPLKGGKKADLALSRERTTGETFAGFDRTDGVWLLGLTCSTCQNPQPVVLSVLDLGSGSP